MIDNEQCTEEKCYLFLFLCRCDALPDWIFSFDTGLTIEADPLVSYTMECSSDMRKGKFFKNI